MSRSDPGSVQRITCVGGGVIGGGWAAHFLARGYRVTVQDPGAGAQAALDRLLDTAWPTLQRLGLASGATRDNLRFTTVLAEALANAEFVQESATENLDLKRSLFKQMDELTDPEVVIASSTSGLLMSDIQADSVHPQRMVLGHPFNPPYILPLVEVVGGGESEQSAVDWAADFYAAAGKHPLKMDREVSGHVCDRLQEAMWREALHMVAAGEATVEQLDDAITYGPGLRWAFMGQFLNNHLSGGEGGMAYFLDQFGPALLEPWSRLDAPELTKELCERIVQGAEQAAGGRSIAELAQYRDRALVRLLALRKELETP